MKTVAQLCVSLALVASIAHAADTKNGAKLYARHCESCHGINGRDSTPGTPEFSRSKIMFKADAVLFASIKAGRGAMPGFLGIVRERELFDIIAYLRTLS